MTDLYYFEDISSTFKFGKYKGEPLYFIIWRYPSYIYWCIDNISDFIISPNTLDQIRLLFPNFIVTQEFYYHTRLIEDIDEEFDNESEDEEWRCTEEEHPTYEKYAGSYAQDEMGYSDDDIDTIFDGDPNAYWNID